MSNEHEDRTCQAERDYDFMQDEKLLASALTDDDHRDESEWHDFLETKVRYYSNAVLDKALSDLINERNVRVPAKDTAWVGAADAVEIHHALKALLNKESVF